MPPGFPPLIPEWEKKEYMHRYPIDECDIYELAGRLFADALRGPSDVTDARRWAVREALKLKDLVEREHAHAIRPPRVPQQMLSRVCFNGRVEHAEPDWTSYISIEIQEADTHWRVFGRQPDHTLEILAYWPNQPNGEAGAKALQLIFFYCIAKARAEAKR